MWSGSLIRWALCPQFDDSNEKYMDILNTNKGFLTPILSPTQTSFREIQVSETAALWTVNSNPIRQEYHVTAAAFHFNYLPVTHLHDRVLAIPNKYCLIIILRQLNKSWWNNFYKMECVHLLSDLLAMNDSMVKGVASYYAVTIHQQSQSLLSFLRKSRKFQFTRLPFGLSCVPIVFTKHLKSPFLHVVAYLRERERFGW